MNDLGVYLVGAVTGAAITCIVWIALWRGGVL